MKIAFCVKKNIRKFLNFQRIRKIKSRTLLRVSFSEEKKVVLIKIKIKRIKKKQIKILKPKIMMLIEIVNLVISLRIAKMLGSIIIMRKKKVSFQNCLEKTIKIIMKLMRKNIGKYLRIVIYICDFFYFKFINLLIFIWPQNI